MLETVETGPCYKIDLRTGPPKKWVDLSATDWGQLTWRELGRPYEVKNYSRHRQAWERDHGHPMPVEVQWENFNRRFHELFAQDLGLSWKQAVGRLARSVASLSPEAAVEALEDVAQLSMWNYVHRMEDAVWDPRGKRVLFGGLELEKPRILFLGAADGYEAMQLLAMYPGGEAVLVDYDDFCRTDRFGKFPERYPFLGRNPSSGHWNVYHREDFEIEFVVADIRNLKFGAEFDVVLSVGLVEHFPDEYKPMVFDFHRRYLKPGGYAILTTPRREIRSKIFYQIMGELMNYGYRELMDARQLGRYAWENGFEIVRCGWMQGHNGVIARVR